MSTQTSLTGIPPCPVTVAPGRYDRQVSLPEIGPQGQQKLSRARVAVIGAGGLGAAAIMYLAGAGVGEILAVDNDRVEVSNLHRQVLYRSEDLGRPKPVAARDQAQCLNPDCRVVPRPLRLSDARQARELLRGMAVALDATDNFDTRFLLSDQCWLLGIPLVSAAAVGFNGQLQVIDPRRRTPCYRCLVTEMPDASLCNCRTAGILGPVAGVMGALQAQEALKIILGLDSQLLHALLHYNGLTGGFITMRRARLKDCPLCGGRP